MASSDSSTDSLPSKQHIRRDVLRLLREHPDRRYEAEEMARALGYETGDTYLRFCDVLAEMSAEGDVRAAGKAYTHAGDAAPSPAPSSGNGQQKGAEAQGDSDAAPASKAGASSRGESEEATSALGASAEPADPDIPRPEASNEAIGRLSLKPQGYGFIRDLHREEEYFIREHDLSTALDGDIVRVGVAAEAPDDRLRRCEVLEVVRRKRTQIVGTFRRKDHFAIVEPDDQRILQDVFVKEGGYNGAKPGEKVVVSIDEFEDRRASPEGRVLRVLGPGDDPQVRVLSLAMSMDVATDFPDEVEAEAEAISTDIPQSEIDRRLDLREKDIFTIDPVDAKDFDDAIHIDRLDNGHVELGVHIADVSHYVEPDSALDEEALSRATSVYLVDRTIPMLPEKLSNQVCSLRPNEDKLAFSCIMEVTPHGEVVDYQITESVIHSKQRLTYDRAQDYIDGGYPDDPVSSDVVQANRLAKTLTKKRMREGSVDFDTPEAKVLLDDEGHPIDIVRKERQPANRLIEECMLLANRTVAHHIGDASFSPRGDGAAAEPKPFIYRVHGDPDADGIQRLASYVKAFGYELTLNDGNAHSTDLNDLLKQIKGQPEEPVITRAALRAMSKAEYDVKNIGHYGLGFSHYTHFTSPIRRYPDLIVHRLLKHYAEGGEAPDVQMLRDRCEHCSEQERHAEEAERESVKLKQVEYVQDRVGETFEGVVSGVTKFGVFVEMNELLVEGLVHVREMDDYYVYDEETYTLRGKQKGQTFRPGDEVKVKIVGANVDKREVDLLFVD